MLRDLPMRTYLLGIDTETTGAKALLVNSENGTVQASATTEYPMLTPQPLWVEQNPADWRAATVTSVCSVLRMEGVEPHRVVGIGLTGQTHGLVLLESGGRFLRMRTIRKSLW